MKPEPNLEVGDIVFLDSIYDKNHFYILLKDLGMEDRRYPGFKVFYSFYGKICERIIFLDSLKNISEGIWKYR